MLPAPSLLQRPVVRDAVWTASGRALSPALFAALVLVAGVSAGICLPVSAQDSAAVTATASGFAPPDIAVLTFDDPGDEARLRACGGPFPTGNATLAPGRTGQALRIVGSRENAGRFIGLRWPATGRVFVRLWIKTDNMWSGNVKLFRFNANGCMNNGGLFGGWTWGFDAEGQGEAVRLGISPFALSDGRWHSIEMDYNRNDGANVSARVWVDGKAIMLPGGPLGYGVIRASGGNWATDAPSTVYIARSGPSTIDGIMFLPTITDMGGTGTLWIDDVAVSSTRIGP